MPKQLLSSRCCAITTRHLCLHFASPSLHTKVVSCHCCKKNHVVDISCDLHFVSASLRPWIFLILGLPFSLLSAFYPRVVANSSQKRNRSISRYHRCCKWGPFPFYRRSLHCRYCQKPRVLNLRCTSMVVESVGPPIPLLWPPYPTSTLVRNFNAVPKPKHR